ncbi:MAG TPA: ATP-binding protein [Candidatus Dormibacteraeota bacterium]|nr:ATP-binding protein [Candidatus Dormibacteraeota bacterium]
MNARRAVPFAVAVLGAAAVTGGIALVQVYASVGGLSALYLLLVLWLGARWGRWPAVTASVAAFLLYDFFFVPPVGTFTVAGPSQLLELFVLLAVALVTSQLAASLRRTQATAEAMASQSRALYELATAALRSPEASRALALLCERARAVPGVRRFGLASVAGGKAAHLSGDELTAHELTQAAWSFESGRAVGISVSEGTVRLMRTHPGRTDPAYLPMDSGVAVVELDADGPAEADLRMLAALIGLAGLLLDRRRAALEAERARGLEASDRLKAAILSSVSHELKSPIASLRAGLTALAAPGAGLASDQQDLARDMDRQATRLDHMVGDMLALSRLEAGVELHREPHSFADLVGTSVRQVRSELQGHDLEVDAPADLPAVDVDETQVGRVLTNLLENAAEWSPAGGGIGIGAASRDGKLEAWVENDGPAIPPTDLDRVFDTFWTRRATGTGLGLAICKRVVEAHGGTIRAENMRRGPRFTFTLPLARLASTHSQ